MRLDKIRAKLWPARMDQRMQIRWDSVAIFFSPICWPIPLLVSGSVLDQEQPTTHPPHINYISFWENFRHGIVLYTPFFLVNVFFWGNGLYTRLKPITIRQKKFIFVWSFFLFYYLSPHSFLSDLNFGVRLSIGTGPFFVKIGPGLFWTVIFSDWIGLI